ncbi:MAG: TIGR00730 family Rossman fold protein [Chloroflexi bacterium]|jgi:uncharacterized protein (TIGR00730 family)|nr:TIGR00730 family Rossman fold protein [Chloroflexota bacterium]
MRICVYCSSSSRVDEAYFEIARELGQMLAAGGHTLIYGGANIGLMGTLASAVKEAGGQVVGVIPCALRDYGLVYEGSDEIIVTETMAERKAIMERRAEAFIALPGGFGTLEELLEVLTLRQLRYLDYPIVVLNANGFYDVLLAHFERLYDEQFANPGFRQLYYVALDAADAMRYLETAESAPLPSKW